jgi:hypothetical protein
VLNVPPQQAAAQIRRVLREHARIKVRDACFARERPTGFAIERIVFTYLDYLLVTGAAPGVPAAREFTFGYRTSIEHFFPQYPDREQAGWDRVSPDDPELNMFGNLALISVGANSKFSNNLPENKSRFADTVKQSAKLMEMVRLVGARPGWDRAAIREHDAAMTDVLRHDLRSNGVWVD